LINSQNLLGFTDSSGFDDRINHVMKPFDIMHPHISSFADEEQKNGNK
jgi:hypothetical protein